MGYFDNLLNPNDPNSMGVLGLLQGLGAASMPSRLPVPTASVFANALSGMAQGRQQALSNRQAQLGYDESNLDYQLKSALLKPYLSQLQGQGAGSGGAPQVTPATAAPGQNTPGGSAAPATGAISQDALTSAVNQAESGGNDGAVSSAGAKFAMQVMPNTLRAPGYGVKPASNGGAAEGDRVGSDYLKAMVSKYNGNTTLGLIAYNWGPGNTDKWIAGGADPTKLPAQTQAYIGNVQKFLQPGAQAAAAAAPSSAGGNAQGAGGSPMAAIYSNPMLMSMLGIKPTDYQQAMNYANSLPAGQQHDDALAYAHHLSGFDNSATLREGGIQLAWDPSANGGRGGMSPVFKNPKLPEGMTIDDSGNAQFVPGALQGTAAESAADVAGKNSQTPTEYHDPTGAEHTTTVGNLLGATGAPGAQPGGAKPGGDIKMPDGTIVPAPGPLPGLQRGANGDVITGPSTADKDVAKASSEQIGGLFANYNTNVQLRQRLVTIAGAMKAFQTGSSESAFGDWASRLKAMGVDIVPGQNAAQVQIVLKNAALGAADALHSRISRWTQSEFQTFMKNLANPDLQPKANLEILGQGIGLVDHDLSMARGWQTYRQAGGVDPSSYLSGFNDKNPLQGFVDRAKSEIGPLKGMPGQAPSAAQGGQQQAYTPKPAVQAMINDQTLQKTAAKHGMTVPQLKSYLRQKGYQVQ